MSKGQEDQEAQEPKWEVFVDKFNSLGMESLLRSFEIKEREKIGNSPLNVRDSFDKKWRELTGKPYYQAITTVQQVMAPFDGRNDTRRSDPRSLNYREPITFTKLFWQKIRRKRGKKMHDFFIIEGLTEAGARRPLFGGISVERLFMVFGDNIASMIVADAKKEGRGELKENIEIPVEGYWEVQFAPQKDTNDEKDVLKAELADIKKLIKQAIELIHNSEEYYSGMNILSEYIAIIENKNEPEPAADS